MNKSYKTMMSKRHKHTPGKHFVKLLRWLEGVLDVNDYEFDDFESALAFCDGEVYDSLKIYDSEGNLVFEGVITGEFYA